MAPSILEDLSEQTFTESTIRKMYRLIDRAKTDAEFQKLVYGLVNSAMPGQWKDYRRELSTVFNWFKKNVDYRRDPYGVELLQDVWATLDRKRADCDDATTWMAAASEILGSPSRIVTVSTRQSREPNHVYAEALVGGRWQGLDATIPQSYVGWAPPHVTARRIWTRKELGLAGDEDLDGIEGLGMSDNGYGSDGFGTNMRPVSRLLAPESPTTSRRPTRRRPRAPRSPRVAGSRSPTSPTTRSARRTRVRAAGSTTPRCRWDPARFPRISGTSSTAASFRKCSIRIPRGGARCPPRRKI